MSLCLQYLLSSPVSLRNSISTPYEDGSPIPERIARARANSSRGNASPFSPAGDSDHLPRMTTRMMSPDPDDISDGSPVSRRTFRRFGSPSYSRSGSPMSSPQPREDAIEEMKRRFLRQSTPSSDPPTTMELPTQKTPTRRSTSRPRASDAGTPTSPRGTPGRGEIDDLDDLKVQPLRTLRMSSSVSSLRTSQHRDRLGGIESSLQHDETTSATTDLSLDSRRVESTNPNDELEKLIESLHRDRTGDAEVESFIGSDPTTILSDLIDLSSPEKPNDVNPRATSTGPMSQIPVPIRPLTRSHAAFRDELRISGNTSSMPLPREYDTSVPPTPDLADFSDAMSNTASSGPSTPPSASPSSLRSKEEGETSAQKLSQIKDTLRVLNENATTPTSKSKTANISSPTPLSTEARCARCNLPLFNLKDGGKFVSVPEEPSNAGAPPKTYHTACFTCKKCGGSFEERDGGQAVFVRGEDGPCHVEVSASINIWKIFDFQFACMQCAPPQKISIRPAPSAIPKLMPSPVNKSPGTKPNLNVKSRPYVSTSSRYDPPPPTAPPTSASFTFPPPRFGGSSSCPGCHKAVAVMERGVVQGPQGTKWHAACLICGGHEAKGRRKEAGKPGCAKKLDSAAKTDNDGQVWCRECLVSLVICSGSCTPC